MEQRERVCAKLESLNIRYELLEHPAAYTVEDIDTYGVSDHGDVCKNLFLRDAKGKRHFLVTMPKDKACDIAKIQEQLGTSRLSFGSAERLWKYLSLHQGEVTPLGIINDNDAHVEVVFDRELSGKTRLGVHPNDNTATVWLSFDDIVRFVRENGNDICLITI